MTLVLQGACGSAGVPGKWLSDHGWANPERTRVTSKSHLGDVTRSYIRYGVKWRVNGRSVCVLWAGWCMFGWVCGSLGVVSSMYEAWLGV